MKRQDVLDLYFVEARFKLIDVAAFLDRVQRAHGPDDYRLKAFRAALRELPRGGTSRAKRVLLKFSDPTRRPIAAATSKGATGAWLGRA
jgi:hypothetical protein